MEIKAVHVIKNFTKVERNRLTKFIDSPYFNSNENLSNYYHSFINSINSVNESTLLVNASVAYDKKLNKDGFNKINHALLELVMQFLQQENLKTKKLLLENLLVNEVNKRKIESLRKQVFKQAERSKKRTLERSFDHHLESYRLEHYRFMNTSEFERKVKSKRNYSGDEINSINQSLNDLFATEKLRVYCIYLSWNRVVDLNIEFPLIKYVERWIKNNETKPLTKIYYLVSKTFTDFENDTHYYELKKLLQKNKDTFGVNEGRIIYDAILNYCIQKTNIGEASFQEELLDAYMSSLNSGFLLNQGYLNPTSFRNICFIAMRLRKYEWVSSFMDEYAPMIKPENRDNALTFNKARLSFYQKDYPKVLELLNQVEYQDAFYNLNSKTLMLASYYELDEYLSLNSLIESFRAYIRRLKGTTKERKSFYMDLLKYTQKLMRIDHRDHNALEKLKKEVIAKKGVVNKQWLLEKIDELL